MEWFVNWTGLVVCRYKGALQFNDWNELHIFLQTIVANTLYSQVLTSIFFIVLFQPFPYCTLTFFIIQWHFIFLPLFCLALLLSIFHQVFLWAIPHSQMSLYHHFWYLLNWNLFNSNLSLPVLFQFHPYLSCIVFNFFVFYKFWLLSPCGFFSWSLSTLSFSLFCLSLRCEGDLLTLWSKEYWPEANVVEEWPAPGVNNASVSQDSSLLPSPLTFAPM